MELLDAHGQAMDEHNSKQADGPYLAEVGGLANGGRPHF